MTDITFDIAEGATLAASSPEIARLRIDIFRDFPYLYDGTMEYEEKYLESYLQPGGFAVLVRDGGETVGAGTGIPLAQEAEEFRAAFAGSDHDLSAIFYIGELILLPQYRGKGLGRRLLAKCEAGAHAAGHWRHLALATVVRPDDHPAQPPDYISLDNFWRQHGYVKMPHLQAMFPWREVGEREESLKPMVFWLKDLPL